MEWLSRDNVLRRRAERGRARHSERGNSWPLSSLLGRLRGHTPGATKNEDESGDESPPSELMQGVGTNRFRTTPIRADFLWQAGQILR